MAVSSTYGTWTTTWPWPRIIFTSNYMLGFAKEGSDLYVFEMFNTYGNWYANAVGNLGAATDIDQITVADFNTFYVIATYASSIGGVIQTFIRDILTTGAAEAASDDMTNITEILDSNVSIPLSISVCNFNGQCISGGLESTVAPWANLGLNAIAWSGIGSLEFNPSSDRTAGFTVAPWNGKVFRIMKLGNAVIVYGDEGKARMPPAVVGNSATFGREYVFGLGVPSGNHIAGDDIVHGFIDRDNEFWIITENDLQKLGYKEYIDSLTSDDIIVSYLPKDKRFYISDGSACYVITEHGAYSTHQLPTSVGYRDDVLYGFFEDSGDTEARIATHTLDFNIRGRKTLTIVECGFDHPSGYSAYAAADYRFNKTDSFTALGWKLMSPEGFATLVVGGAEFRVKIKVEDYTDVKMDYLINRVKLTDRRSIRGPNARWIGEITE